MLRIFIIAAMISVAAGFASAAQSAVLSAAHDLSVRLDPATRTLTGQDAIRLDLEKHSALMFFLAREAKIKSLEIVEALEGEVSPVDCGGCPYSGACSSRGLWDEVGSSLESKLGDITLSDLIKK